MQFTGYKVVKMWCSGAVYSVEVMCSVHCWMHVVLQNSSRVLEYNVVRQSCTMHIVQSRAVRVKAKQEKAADGCDFSASWQTLFHPLSPFSSFYLLFYLHFYLCISLFILLIQISCNHKLTQIKVKMWLLCLMANTSPHYSPFCSFISLFVFWFKDFSVSWQRFHPLYPSFPIIIISSLNSNILRSSLS